LINKINILKDLGIAREFEQMDDGQAGL